MSDIRESIEIDRTAEDVFAYLDEHERHKEWQDQIVSARVESDGPIRVGTRVIETRRMPGGERDFSYEITEHDPPRRASFRGVAGPVRPHGTVTVEPAGEGRSRVTLELDLEGHGLLGKVLAPLALSQLRKLVPQDHQRLKERLEAGA